jgi:uncharacterized metal-binding protein
MDTWQNRKEFIMANCAGCKPHPCYEGKDCARGYDYKPYDAPTRKEYAKAENLKVMNVSTRIEGEHYMEWTRLEEIIGFAKQMGYKRIGIAHCVGFLSEAKTMKDILDKDFEVHTICCKFSKINKQDFHLTQIHGDRYESICNSIGQAMVLNDLKTDMNIILGLCVGHDMLFTKYSEAPVTTFVVKDRVTGHNPVVSLYSRYHRKKFTGEG